MCQQLSVTEIHTVLSEYHPMTVRQAYYQLVSLPDVACVGL